MCKNLDLGAQIRRCHVQVAAHSLHGVVLHSHSFAVWPCKATKMCTEFRLFCFCVDLIFFCVFWTWIVCNRSRFRITSHDKQLTIQPLLSEDGLLSNGLAGSNLIVLEISSLEFPGHVSLGLLSMEASFVVKAPSICGVVYSRCIHNAVLLARHSDKLIMRIYSLLPASGSFLAETSIRSPWKPFIFTIKKNLFWMKTSRKYII